MDVDGGKRVLSVAEAKEFAELKKEVGNLRRGFKKRDKKGTLEPAERLNFLHQACAVMGSVHEGLARAYAYELRTVAQRTVTRLSREVRNSYCRRCLRPSSRFAQYRLKSRRRGTMFLMRCTACEGVKRYAIGKRSKLIRKAKLMKQKLQSVRDNEKPVEQDARNNEK